MQGALLEGRVSPCPQGWQVLWGHGPARPLPPGRHRQPRFEALPRLAAAPGLE